MNVISIFLARTEEQVVEFFKKKKATTSENAIELNLAELKASLETPEVLEKNLLSYKFIKKTNNGKYFLDQEVFDNSVKLTKKIILYGCLASALIVLFMVGVSGL